MLPSLPPASRGEASSVKFPVTSELSAGELSVTVGFVLSMTTEPTALAGLVVSVVPFDAKMV
jgi:hypothetical protein